MQQNKVGTLSKDLATSKGPFVDEWKKIYADICKDVEEFDIALALSSACFATKDEAELRAMRTASKACVALTHSYLLDEIANTFDQCRKPELRGSLPASGTKAPECRLLSTPRRDIRPERSISHAIHDINEMTSVSYLITPEQGICLLPLRLVPDFQQLLPSLLTPGQERTL